MERAMSDPLPGAQAHIEAALKLAAKIDCKRDFGTLFNQLELQWPQSSMPAEIELTNELIDGDAGKCGSLQQSRHA
jgi:hypothetical protein